jgi:hypothetical protein
VCATQLSGTALDLVVGQVRVLGSNLRLEASQERPPASGGKLAWVVPAASDRSADAAPKGALCWRHPATLGGEGGTI